MNKFCVAVIIFFSFVFNLKAQDTINGSETETEFRAIALAYNLAAYAYEHHDPIMLGAAAHILIQNPVKGKLDAKIISGNDTSIYFPVKETELNPKILLEDAIKLASDETTISQLKKQLEELDKEDIKDRGRQYSPYVQEYILQPLGNIVLKTTFVEKEIAEVFVVNYNGMALDLKIYDTKGKLLIADPDKIANCYVSFKPVNTSDFKIEIKNKSKQKIQCLLMTN